MKKAFKWILRIVGVLVILLVGFAVYLKISGIPTYTPQTLTLTVESTPARIEKGEKMMSMLCKNCHYSDISKKLTGAPVKDIPAIFGTSNSFNITQDKEKGIGA